VKKETLLTLLKSSVTALNIIQPHLNTELQVIHCIVQWQFSVNAVINLRVPYKVVNFLTSWQLSVYLKESAAWSGI
jgi:hypothetical protein